MLSFVARRLLLGLLTLFVISVFVFAATEMLPGDIAAAILGQERTPEAERAIRLALNLDQPAILRYLSWLADFLRGDLGHSLVNGRSVAEEVGTRFSNTLFLAATVAAIAVPLAVSLGILTAVLEGSTSDGLINAVGLALISLPDFFVAYALVFLLSVSWQVFPSLAMIDASQAVGARLYAIALPAITLVLGVFAYMMRLTRASLIAVMNRSFVEMAVLKGLPKWRVVCLHALPNALAPIINVVAQNIAHLVVAVVVVEVIFVYPGIGQLMIDAVLRRDVPMVQACGLIFAGVYVSINMIADCLIILSNPRLRRPR